MVQLDINKEISLQRIRDIKQYLWIDRQTRAVLLEFSTYNANVDLLAFTSMLVEFPVTQGAVHSCRTEVMKANALNVFTVFLYICRCLLAIGVSVWIGFEVRKFIKVGREYFGAFSTWINWLLIFVSLGSCIIYLLFHFKLDSVLSEMNEDKNKYIDFGTVSLYQRAHRDFIGMLNALAIFKVVTLLKLNRRISLFMVILKDSGGPLVSFFMVFFVLIMAYASISYLWYGFAIAEFQSVLRTLYNLTGAFLGSFGFLNDLVEVNSAFSHVYFITFQITSNFVMLNVMVALLMESYEVFKNDSLLHPRDHELKGVMVDQIWTSIRDAVLMTNKLEE